MANLRKRVAECDLTRSSKPLCEREGFYANNDIPNEENGNDNQDSRPLLSPKVVVTYDIYILNLFCNRPNTAGSYSKT